MGWPTGSAAAMCMKLKVSYDLLCAIMPKTTHLKHQRQLAIWVAHVKDERDLEGPFATFLENRSANLGLTHSMLTFVL